MLVKHPLVDYQDSRGRRSSNWLADTTLDLDFYKCPSDTGYKGYHFTAWKDSGLSSYDHYGTSYTACTLWGGA
ncbi:MAG: hypothetical protein IID43_01990 [Planctomycetes bacterium]|nr:hypothetical protein [Planctomycetota bacterium]